MVDSGGEERRVRLEGKWEVWNVLWWRRRWPERDLGSIRISLLCWPRRRGWWC